VDTEEDITIEDMAKSSFAKPSTKATNRAQNSKTTITHNDAKEWEEIQQKIKGKKHNFGILFSKIGPKTDTDVYSSDIDSIVTNIFESNPDAFILPHSNSAITGFGKQQLRK
jgi:hypothetical protein